MHATEMDQGSKDDFLRIWNVVWKLGYIRCRDGLKLCAGKCNIWYTMKIISKINSTCMSWIILHEEAPARSLKISLIRRDWNFLKLHLNPSLGNYIDCNLIDWQKNFFTFQALFFGWKSFSVFIHFTWQHVCFLQSLRKVLS